MTVHVEDQRAPRRRVRLSGALAVLRTGALVLDVSILFTDHS